jgi:alkylation response protein AidB-like acyl-CoA dehydrogenase
MIKYSATDVRQVVDECLQLFGGYGYMGLSISRMYVDNRIADLCWN